VPSSPWPEPLAAADGAFAATVELEPDRAAERPGIPDSCLARRLGSNVKGLLQSSLSEARLRLSKKPTRIG
jgi:hypothetical protein